MGILQISVTPDPARERGKVDQLASDRMASELETRLKAFFNPGFRDGSSTVRVAAEGNRLVVVPESAQDVSDRGGLLGEVSDDKRALLAAAGTFEDHVDNEMRQIFEFDYPRFLDDALRQVSNEDPRYTFEEDRL